jgi:transposase
MSDGRERIDLRVEELDELVERAERGELGEGDARIIKAMAETLKRLSSLLEEKDLSIGRLKRMLFGAKTEKLEKGGKPNPTGSGKDEKEKKKKEKRKGHGRNGAAAYRGAERLRVAHSELKPGDPCPLCPKGRVYEMKRHATVVRVVGCSPLQATVYELQRLRCNLCGGIFTAEAPEGCGAEKYSPSAASIVAVLKYGSGLPFNRLEKLQRNFEVPLPASTQWQLVERKAKAVSPLYDELIRLAAQGQVLHNDDTSMKVLDLMKDIEGEREKDPGGGGRTGIFTTGILSRVEGHLIALYYTGRQHAGENLADVLLHRETDRSPPIQMCDALSRNAPQEFSVILANCLAHARRKYTDIATVFPQQCDVVLQALKKVYKNDKECRTSQMSPEARLRFHRRNSAPVIKKLKAWLMGQIDEKEVEPNSSLGQAFFYMLEHWKPLTLFLRVPGAPLDNNMCEQVLKRAILHRKNSLFYRTQNGADVGDMFMSIIHTCDLAGVNAFEYLNALEIHAADVAARPALWLPWNYTEQSAPSRSDGHHATQSA